MNDTEKAFMEEFKALLRKYNADFEVRCDMRGWDDYHAVAEVSFNTPGAYSCMEMPKFEDGK